MSFPQGIAFRSTVGFVTDGANDFAHTAQADDYPTTSTQGNNVGYEVNGANAAVRDRNAGNDPRIAGCNFSAFLTTFRMDLDTTGNKAARVAMGDAASYGQAAKCEIFDGTTSLGILSSTNTSGSQRFRDATDTEYTNVTWPGSNTLSGSLTFASTICRFKFGDGSNQTCWAYVYVEAAGGGGGTSVALTGVSGTGSVGSVAPSVSAALTGNAGIGTVGSVAPAASLALTGNAGTGALGSVSPSVSVALTGVSGTGAVGTLTPVSGVFVALTGVSGTGEVGSLAPTVALGLTGVQAAGTVGTLTANGAAGGIELGSKKTRGRAKQRRLADEQRIAEKNRERLDKPAAPVVHQKARVAVEPATPKVSPALPAIARKAAEQAAHELVPAATATPAATAPASAPVKRDLAAEVDFKMEYWARFLVLVINNSHNH